LRHCAATGEAMLEAADGQGEWARAIDAVGAVFSLLIEPHLATTGCCSCVITQEPQCLGSRRFSLKRARLEFPGGQL
jgi:hypothetical protein